MKANFQIRSGLCNLILFGSLGLVLVLAGCDQSKLTPYDMKRAKEFVLSSLPDMPPDPSNRYADDPAAAALGKELFFDTGLSINSAVACATCHMPEKGFQDDLPVGVGISEVKRRTMPLRGVQWGQWFFWDGRKDSQWSQALGPMEAPEEHGMLRDMIGREVLTRYRDEYAAIFGEVPDITAWPYHVSPAAEGKPMKDWAKIPVARQREINRVFANIGKALAGYQRTLLPQENRVDRFLTARLEGKKPDQNAMLTQDEIQGFKLFTGKARCDNCHSGPLYTDHFFHNTGVPVAKPDEPDYGRAAAIELIRQDPFNCLGEYSDARPGECRDLEFMSTDENLFQGSFKTPSLRGVSKRAPYMHSGQIGSLEAVVDHYVMRPDPFADLPEMDGEIKRHGNHNEAPMIELTKTEKRQLIAFLKAL